MNRYTGNYYGEKIFCEICQVFLPRGSWRDHLEGRKHRTNEYILYQHQQRQYNVWNPSYRQENHYQSDRTPDSWQTFSSDEDFRHNNDDNKQLNRHYFDFSDGNPQKGASRQDVSYEDEQQWLNQYYQDFPGRNSQKKVSKKANKRRKKLELGDISITKGFITWGVLSQLASAENVEEQMKTLSDSLRLNKDNEDRNEMIRKDLEDVFSVFIPNSQVHMFGSSANGLGMFDSDLDTFLDFISNEDADEEKYIEKKELDEILDKIWSDRDSDALERLSKYVISESQPEVCRIIKEIVKTYVNNSSNVISITRTRVPVVKFDVSGTNVDITTHNRLALQNTKLVLLYQQLDPRVPLLMFAVRTWARQANLTGSGTTEKFRSYAISILTIYFLQKTEPPVIPTVLELMGLAEEPVVANGWECGFQNDITKIPPSTNQKSCVELLREFFVFYSRFDFGNQIICPRTGTTWPKKQLAKQRSQKKNFLTSPIAVRDPFDLDYSVTKNVSLNVLRKFKRHLTRAVQVMERSWQKDKEEHPEAWGLVLLFKDNIVQAKKKPNIAEKSEQAQLNGNQNDQKLDRAESSEKIGVQATPKVNKANGIVDQAELIRNRAIRNGESYLKTLKKCRSRLVGMYLSTFTNKIKEQTKVSEIANGGDLEENRKKLNFIASKNASKLLNGQTPELKEEIQHWGDKADKVILPAIRCWVLPCLGMAPYSEQNTEDAKLSVQKVLEDLNNHIGSKCYLVGEDVTTADVDIACTLLPLYKHVLEPSFRKPFPHVTRWFTSLVTVKKFKKVFDKVHLCQRMATFDANKYPLLNESSSTKRESDSLESTGSTESENESLEATGTKSGSTVLNQ